MLFIEALFANLVAATGMSTSWATVIVAAINAGWAVFAILSFFTGLGLTAFLIREAMKRTGAAAVAY